MTQEKQLYVGDKHTITFRQHGHRFKIGEEVIIKSVSQDKTPCCLLGYNLSQRLDQNAKEHFHVYAYYVQSTSFFEKSYSVCICELT